MDGVDGAGPWLGSRCCCCWLIVTEEVVTEAVSVPLAAGLHQWKRHGRQDVEMLDRFALGESSPCTRDDARSFQGFSFPKRHGV